MCAVILDCFAFSLCIQALDYFEKHHDDETKEHLKFNCKKTMLFFYCKRVVSVFYKFGKL